MIGGMTRHLRMESGRSRTPRRSACHWLRLRFPLFPKICEEAFFGHRVSGFFRISRVRISEFRLWSFPIFLGFSASIGMILCV